VKSFHLGRQGLLYSDVVSTKGPFVE